MRMRHGLALVISLLVGVAATWLPRASQAAQTCECKSGAVVQAKSDDDDACKQACSDLGGEAISGSADDGSGSASDDSSSVTIRRRPGGAPITPGTKVPDPRIP